MGKISAKIILSRLEKTVFLTLLIAHTIPLFFNLYFLTVDGPSHLYNAGLLLQLMDEGTSMVHTFFTAHIQPYPNLLGHIFLAGLLTFLPAWAAEKTLLIILVLGLPLAWRYLITRLNPEASYLSLFIFPFVYGFTFYFGFYNFNLGIILLLWALGYATGALSKGLTTQNLIVISLFTLGLYAAHLLVLLLFYLFLAAALLTEQNKKSLFKTSKRLLLALIPSLIFVGYYFIGITQLEGSSQFSPAQKLWFDLWQVAPAKGIIYGTEGLFTRWIFVVLLLLTIVYSIHFKRQKNKRMIAIYIGLFVLFLAMYFLFPNDVSGGGLLSIRLLLVVFIAWLLLLANFNPIRWLQFTTVFLLTYVSIALLLIYSEQAKSSSNIIQAIVKAESFIKPNSTILPIVENEHFVEQGLAYYLGNKESVVLLKNYEANLPYFPTNWRHAALPGISTKGVLVPLDYTLPESLSNTVLRPDYIFYYGNLKAEDVADSSFTCVYQSAQLKLLQSIAD